MTLPPLFCRHFPTFVTDYSHDDVDVFWYQSAFSQSRYPPGQKVSTACTLICLLVAERISKTKLLLYNMKECSRLNIIIAEAMIEGNAIHAWLVREKFISHPYLNTQEALKYGNLNILREWKFNIFHEEIETSLYRNMTTFLCDWHKAPKSQDLFMLLITCGRTILFILQENIYKVTLFDSHSHKNIDNSNRGLVIAQTTIDKLESLCNWYIQDILKNCYNTQGNQYELAFLYSYKVQCNGLPCK